MTSRHLSAWSIGQLPVCPQTLPLHYFRVAPSSDRNSNLASQQRERYRVVATTIDKMTRYVTMLARGFQLDGLF